MKIQAKAKRRDSYMEKVGRWTTSHREKWHESGNKTDLYKDFLEETVGKNCDNNLETDAVMI